MLVMPAPSVFTWLATAKKNCKDWAFSPIFLWQSQHLSTSDTSLNPAFCLSAYVVRQVWRQSPGRLVAGRFGFAEKQTRADSRRNKTETCPAETSPALQPGEHTERCGTSPQTQTDTRTHARQRSHLQEVRQGRSLSSLGLYQPPIGCGCSPSTGHNGPSGRSGCHWNSLVVPAPPKTLCPCPARSGSRRWWTRRRRAWSSPPGCHSSCGSSSAPFRL